MKPKELASEETLQGIVLQEMKNSDIQGSDVYWLAIRVARAALEKLGIGAIVDVDGARWLDGLAACPLRDSGSQWCQHPLWDQRHCMRGDERNIPYRCNLAKKGAVLVRLEEKP